MREIALQELSKALGSREKAEGYMSAMINTVQEESMGKTEVISQLKSLISNSKSMMTEDDPENNEIWNKDIKALNIAIKSVEVAEVAMDFQAVAHKLSERVQNLTIGLAEIRNNLRCIDSPNSDDEYINDALDITIKLLRECGEDE